MSWMTRDDRPDPLFWSRDGFAVQRALLEHVGSAIDSLPEKTVLNTDPDELARYYVQKYHVDVPVIDAAEISISQHERDVEVYDHWNQGTTTVRGVAFDVEIPFTGEKDVFSIRPSTYDSGPPRAMVRGSFITFTIQERELTAEQVKASIDETVRSIEKYLRFHRQFWAGFDDQILATARQHIQARRAKLQQQNSVASGLANMGFKLKEKAGDPKTYVAPAVKQRVEPKMPPMKASVPPDPTLDRQQYETILGLIRGSGRSIEQSSSRTRNLDEEALRDMLLVPLNAHFGAATGEAFNATGKTDILIREKGSNLFVAECKFWGGEKQFLATIDQLLGYLTWRDTKTAVVIFNRNQGFSAVVAQLKVLPTKHPMFVSGPRRLDDSSFEFTLRLPNDPDKHITLSVLGFDLGPKEA
jgi:hypothetical protein